MDGFNLLRKWAFVPITLEREDGIPILVTDLDEHGKRRMRKLDTGDFRFSEKAVPNWLMLTYVGATEICKSIDDLVERVEELKLRYKVARNLLAMYCQGSCIHGSNDKCLKSIDEEIEAELLRLKKVKK